MQTIATTTTTKKTTTTRATTTTTTTPDVTVTDEGGEVLTGTDGKPNYDREHYYATQFVVWEITCG